MIIFGVRSGYRPILDAAKSLGVDGGTSGGCCRGGGAGGGGDGCPCFDGKVLLIETLLALHKEKVTYTHDDYSIGTRREQPGLLLG